jgi:hypothetical protein
MDRVSRVCGVCGLSGVGPLRRRLFCGGCSWVEYQQIAAGCFCFVSSTDVLCHCGLLAVVVGVLWRGAGREWLVFRVWHTVGS